MENLWITLPALSPDYSGVCSAMFDLGGMSVLHDASGCTGNYTGYDEPRWYGTKSQVFCSGLREIDAVLGRDDKLIDNIIKAAEYTKPTLFSVIGSPVPMVIGSDMEGIACELENLTGLPAFGFSTNGLGLYNKGVSDAMLAVIKRFTSNKKEKIENGINVLGTTPIDFSANSNAADLYSKLEKKGFHIIGKMMMGANIEQIENLTQAKVNLVVTESGLNSAKYLYRKYGLPYVVGMFTGTEEEDLFELINQAIATGENQILGKRETEDKDNECTKKILFVGEQVIGNSIRYLINKRYKGIKVIVGTMTGLRKELANKEDVDIPGEETLINLIESGNFDCLVGDPLIEDLMNDEMTLVKLPHVALSSKLYWNSSIHFIGEEMENIVNQCTI